MTELEQAHQNLKDKVEGFYVAHLSEGSINKYVAKYYKGIQILYSRLIANPKVMFVGINPGAGYFNENKQVVKRFSPMNYHEYYKGGYRLAKQTRKLFQLANLPLSDIVNSVKSNNFFIATRSEDELYKLLSHLKKEKVYYHSAQWIDELIGYVNPQIIICEGKSAFDRLTKNKECTSVSNSEFYHYAQWNNKHILGYNRRFSYILHKEKVAEKLREINAIVECN